MNGISLAILILIAFLICYAVFRSVRRLKNGNTCCGERPEDIKRINVKDKNKAHYPFFAKASITGMTCSNCAIKVENALNGLDGVWATVRVETQMAVVRAKQPIKESLVRDAIHRAGYGVCCIKYSLSRPQPKQKVNQEPSCKNEYPNQ